MGSETNNLRLSYWKFSKFSLALHDAVTLTVDPLTLNFCSTSSVTCSNFLQNLSEIVQVEQTVVYWYLSIVVKGGRGAVAESIPQRGWTGPNCIKFWENRASSSMHQMRYFGADVASFRDEGGSKASGVENRSPIWPFLTFSKTYGRGWRNC